MNRTIIWAIVARFAVVALFFDGIGPLFPNIAHAFSLTDYAFQQIIGVSFIVFAIFQLLSVYVIASLGLYRCILWSTSLLVLTVILLSVVRQPYFFAIVFIAMFAVNSIGSNATRIALRNFTSANEFKRYFAWAQMIIQGKQIIMPVIASLIATVYGWHYALLALGLPIVLVSIWLGSVDRKYVAEPSGQQLIAPLKDIRALLQTRFFVIPISLLISFHAVFAYTTTWFAFVLSHYFDFSITSIGWLLSLASAVMALGFGFAGWLSQYWSNNELLKLSIGLMLLAVSSLLFFTEIYMWVIGVLSLELAYAFVVLPCTAWVMDMHLDYRVSASAVLGFIAPIAGGLAVLLMGIAEINPLIGIPNALGVAIVLMAFLFSNLNVKNAESA